MGWCASGWYGPCRGHASVKFGRLLVVCKALDRRLNDSFESTESSIGSQAAKTLDCIKLGSIMNQAGPPRLIQSKVQSRSKRLEP